jgi:hypothetical protein
LDPAFADKVAVYVAQSTLAVVMDAVQKTARKWHYRHVHTLALPLHAGFLCMAWVHGPVPSWFILLKSQGRLRAGLRRARQLADSDAGSPGLRGARDVCATPLLPPPLPRLAHALAATVSWPQCLVFFAPTSDASTCAAVSCLASAISRRGLSSQMDACCSHRVVFHQHLMRE